MNSIYTVLAISISLALGYAVQALFGGLPASLYGMIIFAALLHWKVIRANKVEASTAWVLRNMGICFVPAGVGIINHFQLIKQHGFTLIAIIFVTTFILLSLVGITFQRLEVSTKTADKNRKTM